VATRRIEALPLLPVDPEAQLKALLPI